MKYEIGDTGMYVKNGKMLCQKIAKVEDVDKATEVKRLYMKNGDVIHSHKVAIIGTAEQDRLQDELLGGKV